MTRIAVIGSGIAGLGAAWALGRRHDVTLYESAARLGGHTNTVDVTLEGRRIAVDTGFIVYNAPNYPHLARLFEALGVATQPTDMSFGVSVDRGRLEYAGSWRGLFAQPANWLKPTYLGMIADVLRFFREAPPMRDRVDGPTLGEFLAARRYGNAFINDHLLPMAAAIWSAPTRAMLGFPMASFARFCANHGLLQISGRPQWRTVVGGAREYVRAIAATLPDIRLASPVRAVRALRDGVIVQDLHGVARYDQVVVAAHGDDALAMIAEPTADERRILGAFRYQPNVAVLHRDPRLMPRRRAAWAAWNYLADRPVDARTPDDRHVCVTYWMNRLQNLDAPPIFVSLNPTREPIPNLVHATFHYMHPVFDAGALAAQRDLAAIQGRRRLWFCGSYCGYGFHEDGLSSGLAVAAALGAPAPWAGEIPPEQDRALEAVKRRAHA